MSPALRLLRGERGYSMAWWAAFLALCLVPLFVLAVEVSRYANIVADVQQAADAAALAAVREIDPDLWKYRGQERLLASWVNQRAQEYISRNTATAATRLAVTGAGVERREQEGVLLVRVEVAGNLRGLWESVLPGRQVKRVGIAALRFRHY
jgi:hypothetical protein